MSPTHFDVNLDLGVSFPERAVFEIRRVFFPERRNWALGYHCSYSRRRRRRRRKRPSRKEDLCGGRVRKVITYKEESTNYSLDNTIWHMKKRSYFKIFKPFSDGACCVDIALVNFSPFATSRQKQDSREKRRENSLESEMCLVADTGLGGGMYSWGPGRGR